VPPTTTAVAAAAKPDRHLRRHLAVCADPTGIAALLSIIWDRHHEARRIGTDADDTARMDNGPGIDTDAC
jgi:hypothetical protein